MKNDLTCAVVRDLLPAYTEGLTEQETNEAVERHLEGCSQCRGLCSRMRRDAEKVPQTEEKELDYLKAVNRRGRRRTAGAVAVTLALVALLAGGIAAKVFVIGRPATAEGMSWSIQTDGNALDIRAFSTWSAVAYCRWETERQGDAVYIRANRVLPSWLYPTADYRTRISLEGVESVYLAGRLIWQDGEAITQRELELMDAVTEYVGSAPDVGRLCSLLGTAELGQATMALRTAQRPYRLTLTFTTGDTDTIHDAMTMNVFYLLALVENLDEVAWQAPDQSQRLWTVERADAYLQKLTAEYNQVFNDTMELPSVKDCGTPANLARLRRVTDYVEQYRR